MLLAALKRSIASHPTNARFKKRGWSPVYTAHPKARILIVGQAPGTRAQESGIPWNDPSGDNLRNWLGVSREQFYDERLFALVPMDFYFPGAGSSGDKPPRSDFAPRWHPPLLKLMPHIKLTILIGQYAQAHYLGDRQKKTLTDTVHAYTDYLPKFLPLVHPSPRNNIWQKKNPWFQSRVIPKIKRRVRKILTSQGSA